jgi:hypothetical protein
MNIHRDMQEFHQSSSPKKPSFLRRILGFFVRVLSSPKGDQGGWEGGARGL